MLSGTQLHCSVFRKNKLSSLRRCVLSVRASDARTSRRLVSVSFDYADKTCYCTSLQREQAYCFLSGGPFSAVNFEAGSVLGKLGKKSRATLWAKTGQDPYGVTRKRKRKLEKVLNSCLSECRSLKKKVEDAFSPFLFCSENR